MIIYIDENLSHHFAEGMNIIQQPLNSKFRNNFEVKSIKKEFAEGAKDEEWIPIAGKQKAVVITRDNRIQSTRHQRDLYKKYGLGIIFISTPKGGLKYWDQVKVFIKKWEDFLKIADKQKKPFAFRFTINGNKIEKLD